MTAAVFRSTPSLSIPPTQNTAPVLEFACLYTHDIRKKAKKWQDGILRYHTFNKRAMVYDVPRNFIGDMHWTGEAELQEGDEVMLEKAGVKVEVAERIGVTETDLSELRGKKGAGASAEPKKRLERPEGARAVVASPVLQASSNNSTVARGNTQLKHRSLNALLGTPKGPIGKAKLPTKSPFEERNADVENDDWENGRPAKKARTAATKAVGAGKQDAIPLWARTADRNAERQIPDRKVFIDLSDDAAPSNDFLPGFSSDALAPSSPVRAATRDVSGSSSSPAFQCRPAAAREKPRFPRVEDLEEDEPRSRAAEPICRIDQPQKPPEPVRRPSPDRSRPSSTRPGQSLRLAASAPKKRTLLCQDQLINKPRMITSGNSVAAVEESIAVDEDAARPKTAQERIQARLEKISRQRARNKTPAAADLITTNNNVPLNVESDDDQHFDHAADVRRPEQVTRTSRSKVDEQVSRRTGPRTGDTAVTKAAPHSRPSHTALERPHTHYEVPLASHNDDVEVRTSHEKSAIELARLDRTMLPPAAPRRAPTPPAQVQVPSPREARPLRRVISEPPSRPAAKNVPISANSKPKRVPGAPVRYTPTPSPTKRSREPTPVPPVEKEVRVPFKSKQKKTLQKSVSLNMTAAGTSTVILGRPFQAPGKPQAAKTKQPEPKPEDVGPWSREAFDLFKWRPPGWDEEKWCIPSPAESGNTAVAPAGLSGGASLPSCLAKEKEV